MKEKINKLFELWYQKEILTDELKVKLAKTLANATTKEKQTLRTYIDFLIHSYRLKTQYEKVGIPVIFN